MKEESGEPRSPRHRSRSPIDRARSPEQGRESPKQEKIEADKEALDSYSASLRLASLEHLTGKAPVSMAGLGFPFGPAPGLPQCPGSLHTRRRVCGLQAVLEDWKVSG